MQMLNCYKNLTRLDMVCRSNIMADFIKSIPVVGRMISLSLNEKSAYKRIFKFLNLIVELMNIFLWKVIYIGVLIVGAQYLSEKNITTLGFNDILLNIIVWATLAGSIMNNFGLEVNNGIEYSISFLRADACLLTKTNLSRRIIQSLVGFSTIYTLVPTLRNLGIINLITVLVILVSGKIIGAGVETYLKSKKENYNITNEIGIKIGTSVAVVAIGVLLVTSNIPCGAGIIYIIAVTMFIGAGFGIKYINSFDDYTRIYKNMFNEYDKYMKQVQNETKGLTIEENNKVDDKNIQKDTSLTKVASSKDGYEFFNKVFIDRHKQILNKDTINIIAVYIILVIGSMVFNTYITSSEDKIDIEYLLQLSIIANWLIKSDMRRTRMFFMNCDEAMLKFRFYRERNNLFKLFKIRVKYCIINDIVKVLPLCVGSIMFMFLLQPPQGNLMYIYICVTIVLLQVLESVHGLAVYYLFQPFTVDKVMKNIFYDTVKDYLAFLKIGLFAVVVETAFFGMCIVAIFTVIYIIIATYLVYKMGPKTFRLKS